MNKQFQNIEMMDGLFSHAQTWITKDNKTAYLRYKMTPMFAELENWLTMQITSIVNHTFSGSMAPIGQKLWQLNEVSNRNSNTNAAQEN